jgi:acylphosphatase
MMPHSVTEISDMAYSTDVDGGAPVALRMTVAGRLSDGYLDFVAERAGWLSLSGWAESHGDGKAIVVAAGPEALVGALEMACVLGPLDALVDTLESEPAGEPVSPGFAIRT